jgi:hypothetical protein
LMNISAFFVPKIAVELVHKNTFPFHYRVYSGWTKSL